MISGAITPIEVPFVDDSIKLIGVRWSDQSATIVEVQSQRTGRTLRIEFESVAGLRMLHELDLASTWLGQSGVALRTSWLFAVHADGWLELESKRDDFYTKHIPAKPAEFLIAGCQECLSVLSFSEPRVHEVAQTSDA
jgi:hypothetical protein